MGLLDKVERGIEKAVRGVFSTGSRAQVEPVEIASRLRREVDHKAITVSPPAARWPRTSLTSTSARTTSPAAQEWGTPLAEELCDVVINHVRSQGYTLQGPVRISFRRDEELRAGDFEITSSDREGLRLPRSRGAGPNVPAAPTRQPVRLQPVLDIDGQRYSLNAPSIVLGRSSEADILVDDTGVSRRHLEIRTASGTTRPSISAPPTAATSTAKSGGQLGTD